MSMILELDTGNTCLKWRIKSSNQVSLKSGVGFKTLSKNNLDTITECRLAVVGSHSNPELQSVLSGLRDQCKIIEAKTLSNWRGLVNSYSDPSRMGVDRWLAMMGAWSAEQGAHLIIDSGTAFKADIIDQSGVHLGGYILPSQDMQRDALLKKTDKVIYQKENAAQFQIAPGQSTEACIDNGINLSQLAFAEYLIATYSASRLWLTGGNVRWLAEQLNRVNAVTSDLVLDGLSAYCNKCDDLCD